MKVIQNGGGTYHFWWFIKPSSECLSKLDTIYTEKGWYVQIDGDREHIRIAYYGN